MRNKILLSVLLFGASQLSAQVSTNVYTIDYCIQQVLNNNFDVEASRYDAEIAKQSATKGNAGLLPNVSLSGGANYSNNNTELIFAGGIPPTNVDGAQSTSYNGSVGVSYTVFNGFANLSNYDRLMLNEQLSVTQLRLTIENAVITVIGLYLDLAKSQEDLNALNETLTISRTRLKRAEVSSELGVSNSLSLLNATVDFNTDSVNVLSIKNQIGALKRQMNFLMGNDINNDFNVETSIKSFNDLSLADILSQAKTNNVLSVLTTLGERVSEVDSRLAKANQYPTVSVNTSYGLNSSRNGAGIVLEQNNIGFAGGLSISIPVFSGGRTKIAIANAESQLAKSETVKKQNDFLIEKEVFDYWNNYVYFQKALELEQKNIQTALLNERRSEDAFKLGQITSVEFRQAQLALLASKNRVNAAKYNLKKAEYQLIRLKGDLVK